MALPTDMFYNTGIATYIWIVTNQKTGQRKGKIQLINATAFHTPMRKSLGSKRKQIATEQIEEITRIFGDFQETEVCKIFDNREFGYHRITVERPLQLNFQVSAERLEKLAGVTAFTKLGQDQQEAIIKALQSLDQDHLYRNREVFIKAMKAAFKVAGLTVKPAMLKIIWQALSAHDEEAEVVLMKNGSPEPDPQRRDYENIPLTEDIDEYFQREVVPHLPDAWIDHSKTKVGYEIPFNRHFYSYVPPRPLEEIDADLDKVSGEIMGLLQEVCS